MGKFRPIDFRYNISLNSLFVALEDCHKNTFFVVVVDYHQILELGITMPPNLHIINAAIFSNFMANYLLVKGLEL